MKSLKEVLNNKDFGLFYGNRILLPFAAEILKAVIERDIIMDFSTSDKGAKYTISNDYTEIYFYDYKNLLDVVSKYEMIKLVVVEKGKNIFDLSNHKKISLHLVENHKLTIEELNDDSLFIE